MLTTLIYISSALREMDDAELDQLLVEARAQNLALDITGMLLYSGGTFMQVLEGERDTALRLYARIINDPRHKDVTLIEHEQCEARCFPDWSMGFRRISSGESGGESGGKSGAVKKLTDFLAEASTRTTPGLALKLLQQFGKDAE